MQRQVSVKSTTQCFSPAEKQISRRRELHQTIGVEDIESYRPFINSITFLLINNYYSTAESGSYFTV